MPLLLTEEAPLLVFQSLLHFPLRTGTSLRINFSYLAKLLTCSLEHDLVDLAITLDDVNRFSATIGEGRDLLGSLGPAHQVSVALEGLEKDNSLAGSHGKSVGKCLVIQCSTSMIVDVLTKFVK